MARDKSILIVEDSPAQALALGQVLEQEGLRVFWAPNGQLGVTMAQQYQPDVILLDIEMPEMDGLEACKRLKEDTRTTDIPIVMLTVHTTLSLVKELMKQGAIDFIPKDAFSIAVVLETLRQLHILESDGKDRRLAPSR